MSATEKPFEREPRYLVIKVNDALAHLSSSEIYALGEMGEKITNGRSSAGKLPLVTVVVEQDWPEFELVWEMIKARVTGKGNDARRVVACLNACAGISTENLEDNLPVKELADRYNAVLKQRDELLEALELQERQNELAAKQQWIDPNDKTQPRYLPHIGEPVLFCHQGKTYYGLHTGGSFKAGHGVTAKLFGTWDCMGMPLPEPADTQKGDAA